MNKLDTLHYRANGKLLITGEYLIMDGAAGLALPLIFNQVMEVAPSDDEYIYWEAFDIKGKWFTAIFSKNSFDIERSSNTEIAQRLKRLLLAANELNPYPHKGALISTRLNFDRFMGLGSSSTLISLIADVFKTDKFKLHNVVSGGSGYDIACTDYDHPIIYQKPSRVEGKVKPLNYYPPFAENLFFVWLGKKQDTNAEILKYRTNNIPDLASLSEKITEITFKITEVKELSNFATLIEVHEELIGDVLRRIPIKKERFSDFKGCIKSLGAWGGDFILAGSENDAEYVTDYFTRNGCDTVYCFKDIVLNEKVIKDDDIDIRF